MNEIMSYKEARVAYRSRRGDFRLYRKIEATV